MNVSCLYLHIYLPLDPHKILITCTTQPASKPQHLGTVGTFLSNLPIQHSSTASTEDTDTVLYQHHHHHQKHQKHHYHHTCSWMIYYSPYPSSSSFSSPHHQHEQKDIFRPSRNHTREQAFSCCDPRQPWRFFESSSVADSAIGHVFSDRCGRRMLVVHYHYHHHHRHHHS